MTKRARDRRYKAIWRRYIDAALAVSGSSRKQRRRLKREICGEEK
jgi:hypothetical protein